MIYRSDYIEAIRPFIDTRLVKVLAGVRRCGKSTIFEMMRGELLDRGIPAENIIFRKYTDIEIREDFTAREMYDELCSSISGKGRSYLFLDELQEVDGWEKAVNSLLEGADVDIYVTGSNSKLMSGEISTYLSGRYVSIPVYTLSFKEYLLFKGVPESEGKKLFYEYLSFGGFPIIGAGNFDLRSAYQIVDGIYSTVITRDISRRHNIRNLDLFDRVTSFIIENVGKTFSANSIVNFLKGEGRGLSVETVYNYIKWLQEAFIIYPCKRYDIQGKAVLKTQEKYYLSDVSLKYAKMGFNDKMVSAMLENIVFLEMKRRGYDVFIGKNGEREIDFIGEKFGDRIYVQVCRTHPTDSDREVGNLMEIKDNYDKYVVTTDEYSRGNENGIRFFHVADFLLNKSW